MSIGLILSVCMPLVSGGDDCDSYIVDVYDSVIPCVVEMEKNRQALDDRYLSCASVDHTVLVDTRDRRTAAQIIADLNAELPYMGATK